MDVLAATLAAEHPAENTGWRVEMASFHETIVGDLRATLWLLYGAVSLLLVIAVSNAAGLVLARLNQHQRDRAVRLALGASVSRLLRQQCFECTLLAAAAGLGGFAVAASAVTLMLALAPPPFRASGRLPLRHSSRVRRSLWPPLSASCCGCSPHPAIA